MYDSIRNAFDGDEFSVVERLEIPVVQASP